ncbi:hypothetical protein [Actinomadura miaoliensis]|uniref:Fibronectin type-III domain-containing protein n=1 Tax=Actinomadura miaoliensis TaxID=430685 RepID=A0ABP7W749_9ACTN
MTTTIVFARGGVDAGSVHSYSTSYAAALAGANFEQTPDATLAYVGQARGSLYHVHQWGTQYSYTAPSTRTAAAAYFLWYADHVTGTGVSRSIEITAYNWGATWGTDNFRTPGQLNQLVNQDGAMVAKIENAHTSGTGRLRAGLEQMSQLSATAALRYILYTGRNRNQLTPSDNEYHRVRTSNTAGTAEDPALFVAETTKHLMDVSLGGQVQLSDGTHVYLIQAATAPDINTISVVWHNGTTASTVHTSPISPGRGGAQTYALCRDASDNLYILNGNPQFPGVLRARGLVKGAGHNWTARDVHNLALPAHEGDIINVAAAWHPQGSGGTIVALVARNAARNTGIQTAYMLLNPAYLLTGSGSAVRASGNAEGLLVDNPAPDGSHNYVNETGTLADLAAAPGSGRGYVICTTKAQVLGDRGAQSVAVYDLNPGGTGFSNTTRLRDTSTGYAAKDADAKSRVLAIDGSQVVTVTADPAADRGVTVVHRQALGTGTVVTLADVRLAAEDITSMPAASVLATSPVWDCIYSPTDNRVWIYYFDQADPRRLMRTHVNLSTGQAGRDQVQVASAVGAAGSTNLAIRVHRGWAAGDRILITVANRTSGGAHSLITVTDLLNWPPTQPTLAPKAAFDATTPATFTWTFNDPNPQDRQSAFQLEIYNVNSGALVHDTGTTTSTVTAYTLPANTLNNGIEYRWRVRTWDDLGEMSPWSAYGTFVTSNSGSLTITDPAVDNDPAIITASYLIAWQVTGTTQDAYRVLARRSDTGAVLVDTGWVTSPATTYLVQGMAAGVEYQIEVTARNAAQVATNTAVRLITPDYASPERPLIAVEPVDDGGYVLVTVINPPSAGDRPTPVGNEIYRRRARSGDPWVLLAEIEPDGTYRDYSAPSGVQLEYMARAGVTG